MNTLNIVELIGYAGSVIVVISLTMRSVVKLRLINLVASLLFIAYGLLINAWPIFILNCLIMVINIYYLRQMQRKNALAFG